MKMIISARHTQISETTRRAIEEQFARLQRFDPRIKRAEVVLLEEKNRCEVEARLSIARAGIIHGHAEAADFRSAVDSVVAKLSRQLKRQRSRARDHKAQARPPESPEAADEAVS